jgi:hypothetical protein
MPTLDDLITQGYQNLILTPEQRQARIDAIAAPRLAQSQREAAARAQQQNENSFGRGMGLSTWNAYQQALNQLMENEGEGHIRTEAQTAVDTAQREALAAAAANQNAINNRNAQMQMSAQNATVQRQLAKTRGTQANQAGLMQGLMGAGGGVGSLALRSLMSGPDARGNTPWQNFKNNIGWGQNPAIEAAPNGGNGTPGTTATTTPGGGDMNLTGSTGMGGGSTIPTWSDSIGNSNIGFDPSWTGGGTQTAGGWPSYNAGDNWPMYSYNDSGAWTNTNGLNLDDLINWATA